VRLSRASIDSPMVTAPNVLVAMNEPSLRKFASTVRSGGWILYNGDSIPLDCAHHDVHALAMPFTRLADELGDARSTNMLMLGTLLEITNALPLADVDAALRRLVKHARWLALDEQALQRGRALFCEWRDAMRNADMAL
jgi:Pyruvate/2-oxoacid:ferredoxin oxidoreductase gamma subunit